MSITDPTAPPAGLARRRFLGGAAMLAGGAAAGLNPFAAMAANAADGRPVRTAGLGQGGYGPLVEMADRAGSFRNLLLPEGFAFRTFGVEGDLMSDGRPTPKAHDGMGALALPNGNVRLIRNHEDRNSAATATLKGDPTKAYDPEAGGSTTSLELRQLTDGDVELVRDFVSISGTFVNCAGGPTPWNSWITSEETTNGTTNGFNQPHGYNFDVAASAETEVDAVPLKAMGRFVHEAVAVDPRTGIVYETEDRGSAGFYRFIPGNTGDMTDGRLQMLAVRNQPMYDTRTGQTIPRGLPVSWVDIADPDPAAAEANASAVFEAGLEGGGAIFARLEGIWYGNGSIYFNSTSGGDAGLGQVWEYKPAGQSGGVLKLIFESPSIDVLDAPDNLTVAPGGGVLLQEDGDGDNLFLRGLTNDGKIFDFAQNIFNGREWCGGCWSPDGRTLLVNVQGDTRGPDTVPPSSTNLGVTIAIWGPFEVGAF